MSTEILILLSNKNAESSTSTYSYGDKFLGAGYSKGNDGLHTVVYSVDSFIGSIKIQGTLAEFPGDNDWVDVTSTEAGLNSDSSAWTTAISRNFYGNFVWIRVAYNIQNGTIISIQYNR